MLRLVTHLEYLLRVHDCIIVPRLGGFVLQVVPSAYVQDEHLFRPTHKEVVFNSKLKHTDGLLHERYMQAYGVSYQRAGRLLEEDVMTIMDELRKGLCVSLGAVGSLSLGSEGQIIFKSGSPETFSVESYGLASFQLKTWETMQEEASIQADPVKRKSNTIYIPVNRRLLHVVTAAAAAAALFFLLSTPVKEVNRDSYKAGFIPVMPPLPSPSQHDESILAENDNLTPEEYGAILTDDEDEYIADAPKTSSVKPSSTTAAKKTGASESAKTVKEASKEAEIYYIIIASVNSRKQADEILSSKVEAGARPRAGILSAGTQIRIYADKFTDKRRAEVFLAQTRVKFPNAWMFTQKK
ncbi:MAG: SPOR domain-containing protein [Tannerellaceae bacterium]|jgi:hypothetical protein|nr:SPOR domain-containing protein [Tannerellaceae bacterium]